MRDFPLIYWSEWAVEDDTWPRGGESKARACRSSFYRGVRVAPRLRTWLCPLASDHRRTAGHVILASASDGHPRSFLGVGRPQGAQC